MRRRLSALALVFMSACSPVDQAEVSKSTAPEQGLTPVLVPDGLLAGPPASVVRRGNAELARNFLDLEFRMESGRSLPVLTRFEGPITVGMSGNVPATAGPDLQRLLQRFRAEAGLDIRMVAPGTPAAITIDFQPRSALKKLAPTAACFVVPNASSLADYRRARNTGRNDWAMLTRRETAAILAPSDSSPQEVRDCLHEELAQAIGPLNDLYQLTDSVFNDDNFHTELTSFDMLMLRVHYAPELRSGMNEAEVASRLPGILARVNPAGQGLGGSGASVTPRAWIAAVEVSFGMGGSTGARQAAAQQMLSMAMAQGWSDSRLALAWYALGRTQVSTDGQAAVRAFTEARRIWRGLPGGAVHMAHADMQLAAIALSAGQPDQAIAFADRAIPVVRQSGNAALLATLNLIKAEALETMGQTAAAQALRLDTAALARYGFGSDNQMRARMQEIASLAARGRRG